MEVDTNTSTPVSTSVPTKVNTPTNTKSPDSGQSALSKEQSSGQSDGTPSPKKTSDVQTPQSSQPQPQKSQSNFTWWKPWTWFYRGYVNCYVINYMHKKSSR